MYYKKDSIWRKWRICFNRNMAITEILISVLMIVFCVLELRWIYDINTIDSKLMNTQSCNGCFKSRLKELANPTSTCALSTPNIIIVVKSRADSFKMRQYIRKSWGSINEMKMYNFKVIYIVGRGNVNEEVGLHDDILQIDLDENYLNVTYKIAMAFHWVVKNCNTANYFMNADDDVFINIPLLLQTLNTYDLTHAIAGCCKSKRTPARMSWSKNKQSFEQYPFRIYPKYCSGAGYILSMKAAIAIEHLIPDTPFSILDDMLIGIIALKTNVEIIDIPRFHYTTWSSIVNNYDQACSIIEHTNIPKGVAHLWKASKTTSTKHCDYRQDSHLHEIGRPVMVHLYLLILIVLIVIRVSLPRNRLCC